MTSEDHSVDCIIPVFNGERYLRAAIDSALSQSHPDMRVIVVDDGSVDGSYDIAASYGGNVSVYRRANGGIGAARNTGLRKATARYVAFLDADDLWTPHKTVAQIDALARHGSDAMCFGLAENFWEDEVAAERERFADRNIARTIRAVIPTTMLVERKVAERIGMFDESHHVWTDKCWVIDGIAMGITPIWIEEVVLKRRIHRTNTTRLLNERGRADIADIITELHRRRHPRPKQETRVVGKDGAE